MPAKPDICAEDAVPADAMCSCVNDCAAILKVLADPNRVLIVRALIGRRLCVNDICETAGLPQHRVSHHLGRMRLAGIVEAERDGRNMNYRISPRIASEDGLDLGCCRIGFRRLPRLSL